MSQLTNLSWDELSDYQKEIAILTLQEKNKKVKYTRIGAVNVLKSKCFEIVYNRYDDEFDILF